MTTTLTQPDTCAYCSESPTYESVWVSSEGKVLSVWLCARCDEKGSPDLMDYFEADPAVGGAEVGYR